MTLTTQVNGAFTRVGTEFNTVRIELGDVDDKIGTLSGLSTTAKTNLVAAINEIAMAAASASGIDDGSTSTASTWSSSKTAVQINDSAAGVKSEILGGAGAAYDTLKELKDYLDSETGGNAGAISTINTALGKRVRTDIASQGLIETEKGNARTNIDAVSTADVGSTSTNFVATFESALA